LPLDGHASAEGIQQHDDAPKNPQQLKRGRPKKLKRQPPQRKPPPPPPPPPPEDLHGRVWWCSIDRRWKSHSDFTGNFSGEYKTESEAIESLRSINRRNKQPPPGIAAPYCKLTHAQ